MPLPDESSRPSASSLIKRFEAINASQEATTPMTRSASASSTGMRRVWSNSSSSAPKTPPPKSTVEAEVETREVIKTPETDVAGSKSEEEEAMKEAVPSEVPLRTTEPESLDKCEILDVSDTPADGATSSSLRNTTNSSVRQLPPIVTSRPSLDVPAPAPVPGSADSLLSATTSLSDLVSFSRGHAKSASMDSMSSRVSHEGLSQPSSPFADSKRLNVPPIRGDQSPPLIDDIARAASPEEGVGTQSTREPMVDDESETRAVEEANDRFQGEANDSPKAPSLSSAESPKRSPSLSKPRSRLSSTTSSPGATRRSKTPSLPSSPARVPVSPTIQPPKIRASILSPTAASLAKTKPKSESTSPSSTPKKSPTSTSMIGRPISKASLAGGTASTRGGASPTPSTSSIASRSSAIRTPTSLSVRSATSPRPPVPTVPRSSTTSSSKSVSTPSSARNTTTPSIRSKTPNSAGPQNSARRSSGAAKEAPVPKTIPLRLASKVRIGRAAAVDAPRPGGGANNITMVSNKADRSREEGETAGVQGETDSSFEKLPLNEDDIPDIPSDDELVFDPNALGRPAPGRLGFPIEQSTGRAVGAEGLENA